MSTLKAATVSNKVIKRKRKRTPKADDVEGSEKPDTPDGVRTANRTKLGESSQGDTDGTISEDPGKHQ